MLVIPEGYGEGEPGTVPNPEAVEKMMKYNEALQKAGVLRALDGLPPPSMGFRVSFSGGKPTVTDGPFAEAEEAVWRMESARSVAVARLGVFPDAHLSSGKGYDVCANHIPPEASG